MPPKNTSAKGKLLKATEKKTTSLIINDIHSVQQINFATRIQNNLPTAIDNTRIFVNNSRINLPSTG
jgi:hypothetical protein